MDKDIEYLNKSLEKSSRPVLNDLETAVKILLAAVGEPTTTENIKIAAEWAKEKGLDKSDIGNVHMSQKERSQHTKGLKKLLRAKRLKLPKWSKEGGEQDFLAKMQEADVQEELSTKALFGNAMAPVRPITHNQCVDAEPHFEEDVAEIGKRFKNGLILEKPQGTSLHHMIDFVSHLPGREASLFGFMKSEFQSFIIEHNWSEAFKNVRDFDGGEVRLPFDYTAFEFRLSGVRVIICLGEDLDGISGVMCTGINKRWYVNGQKLRFENGNLTWWSEEDVSGDPDLKSLNAVMLILGDLIRAVCIMLDSGVAVSDRKAHDPAVNRRRVNSGKKALSDYHVVVLSKRLRSNHESSGEPTGIKKRLHWRRGHWAHYQTPGGQVKYINADGITVSKTWRNWQLVGDESLGFVDKHYSL